MDGYTSFTQQSVSSWSNADLDCPAMPYRSKSDDSVWNSLREVAWTADKLTPFRKDFYRPHPAVITRSEEEVERYKQERLIKTDSSRIRPVTRFEECSLPEDLVKGMAAAGFTGPTPIQSMGWPIALSGKDVVGIAQTGSGKTLSFLLPAIVHIRDQPPLGRGEGPIALVMAPTRELAQQIHEECCKFGKSQHRAQGSSANPSQLYSTCVYGGALKGVQQRDLEAGIHVLVATPGRLLDFLNSSVITLKRTTFLVLDEADRMLDMGFEPQIRKIISQMRPDRQTLMWSATWPPEVQDLARCFLTNPEHIRIGSDNLAANAQIKQYVEFVEEAGKFDLLVKVLSTVSRIANSKVVVFAETKRGCETLFRQLREKQWPAEAIHGDKSQRERDHIIAAFRTGSCRILIATDVASRGLDVKDISHVVNFDFPKQVEDYVHRIGRTARAGATGVAISFFTQKDARIAKELVRVMGETRQEIPPALLQIADRADSTRNSRWRSRSPRHF